MSNRYFGDFIAYGKTVKYDASINDNKYNKVQMNKILDEIEHIISENLKAYKEKRIQEIFIEGFIEYSYVAHPFFTTLLREYMIKLLKKTNCSYSLAFDNAIMDYMKKPEQNLFWESNKQAIQKTYNESIFKLKDAIRKQIDRLMLRKMIENYEDDLVIVVKKFEKEYLFNLPINVVGFVCKDFCNFELVRDLSFAYEIPIIVTNRNVLDSTYLLIDCLNHRLYVDPKPKIVTNLLDQKKHYTFMLGESPRYKSDVVKFYANIVDKRGIEKAKHSTWYAGVGLFRSEYLYITKGYLPTFDELVEIYSELLLAFHDRAVHIRIPDFNDLKFPDYEGNIYTELDYINKFNRVYLTNVLSIYEASKITNKKATIYIPMLRIGKEINRWRNRFDGFLGVDLTEDCKPDFGIMMETESALLYYEDYRDVDSIVIGLNDLLEEAMEISRYDKVDFEEFMLQVFPDLQGAHQYFRRNGIRKLHLVSGIALKQEEILKKLIKKGFKHFCIPLSYIKVAEEVLFEHESTRGEFVGVHAARKK
jgi:phosphoenolpyruvate-protein phosphotransferase (PTS system enzyme I)